jgi:hypothetical protein
MGLNLAIRKSRERMAEKNLDIQTILTNILLMLRSTVEWAGGPVQGNKLNFIFSKIAVHINEISCCVLLIFVFLSLTQ